MVSTPDTTVSLIPQIFKIETLKTDLSIKTKYKKLRDNLFW